MRLETSCLCYSWRPDNRILLSLAKLERPRWPVEPPGASTTLPVCSPSRPTRHSPRGLDPVASSYAAGMPILRLGWLQIVSYVRLATVWTH